MFNPNGRGSVCPSVEPLSEKVHEDQGKGNARGIGAHVRAVAEGALAVPTRPPVPGTMA